MSGSAHHFHYISRIGCKGWSVIIWTKISTYSCSVAKYTKKAWLAGFSGRQPEWLWWQISFLPVLTAASWGSCRRKSLPCRFTWTQLGRGNVSAHGSVNAFFRSFCLSHKIIVVQPTPIFVRKERGIPIHAQRQRPNHLSFLASVFVWLLVSSFLTCIPSVATAGRLSPRSRYELVAGIWI